LKKIKKHVERIMAKIKMDIVLKQALELKIKNGWLKPTAQIGYLKTLCY